MQGALLTETAIRLAWNLSSWEISLELNFVFSLLFFLLPRYIVTLKKKVSFFDKSQNLMQNY